MILKKSHFWGQKRQNQVLKINIFSTNQFFAVQGAFLHLASPFLVCKFVITLFYGSFKDLKKSHFWGQKWQIQIVKIYIFSTNQFLAVQCVFLHQLSPFLVCRLVLTLFCKSFNIFFKNPIFGVKNSKIRYGKYAFLVQISFQQCRACFFTNYRHFWFVGLL